MVTLLWALGAVPVQEEAEKAALDLNNIVSGGVGASIVALAIWIVKLVLDRAIPSRTDARANISLLIEGLNNMIEVLQKEKLADAERLTAKEERIEKLQDEAEKDYDRIRELRMDIAELTARLAQKDRHIAMLVSELRKFGREVTGIDLDAPIDLTDTAGVPIVGR